MDSLSLKGIAAAGGSVIVDANDFSSLILKGIATAGKGKNADLIIKNAEVLGSLGCKGVASCNPGHVIFDFT